MTHMPETGAINQLQKAGSNFWIVCHANPVLVSSRIRFWYRLEHCSIPKQTLACMWLNDDLWLVAGYSYHLLPDVLRKVKPAQEIAARLLHLWY